MRIAVVVKQVPAFSEMALDDDGRLVRAGLALELNPYCRRAISLAVELAGAALAPATVTVVTLGPPSAEDVLREAIAWGLDREVRIEGLLVTDPAFAGSDTLATARTLAAALRLSGPYDLILAGRNSVDSETGQVPPELAELLDVPLLTGVRTLRVEGSTLHAGCEHDDGSVEADVDLPAMLSCAERLIEPCKVDPAGRAAVPAGQLARFGADDLGPGPWGQVGSPTRVGVVRVHEVGREGTVLDGPLADQVRRAVDVLVRRGALEGGCGAGAAEGGRDPGNGSYPGNGSDLGNGSDPRSGSDPGPGKAVGNRSGPLRTGAPHGTSAGPDRRARPAIAVVLEPDRPRAARELLSAAVGLAATMGGHVVAIAGVVEADTTRLGSWGADEVVALEPIADESVGPRPAAPVRLGAEDVGRALAGWAEEARPWAVLAPSTAWGREVAGRAAARLGAGLTGDAVGFDVDSDGDGDGREGRGDGGRGDGRLVAWKPAFGGQVVAAITATSPIQMATVRPGMLAPTLPCTAARPGGAVLTRLTVTPRGRVRIRAAVRDDDTNTLAEAGVVVGVGTALAPGDYAELAPLLDVLGAELGATRKVTDRGWQPHARQIGITGRSIAPRLYVAVGLSGKFNHMVGVRRAGTILAVNTDGDAPVFAAADVGIVGDWREVIPAMVAELRSRA